MQMINFITENYDTVLAVIGAFSMVAAITKNEHDNKFADFLLKAINLFGMNIGKAENK